MSFVRRAKCPEKTPVGPNGEKLCKCGCGQPVEKGRRSWAGQACVDKWMVANNAGHVRKELMRRDHGVCAICGVDSARARKRAMAAQQSNIWRRWGPTNRKRFWTSGMVVRRWIEGWQSRFKLATEAGKRRLERMKEAGWPVYRSTSWWEADHVVPVAEGGGQPQDLSGYRTLCWRCHRKVTRDLLARLAVRRRQT